MNQSKTGIEVEKCGVEQQVNYVWKVESGDIYEGYTNIELFESFSSAVDFAKKHIDESRYFDGDDVSWSGGEKIISHRDGHDYINIKRMEVSE